MKFLVDMPLSPALSRWLRTQGHDAVHAAELNLDRAPDTEILARATEELRTVLTADLDYPRLLALAAAVQPSLILFRGGNWSEADVITRLHEVLRDLDEDYVAHSIIVVERNWVRRRGLPIRAPGLVKKPPAT